MEPQNIPKYAHAHNINGRWNPYNYLRKANTY